MDGSTPGLAVHHQLPEFTQTHVHENSPRQNPGVGSFSLLQGNLPNPGIEPRSPTLQVDSLPAEPQGKPSFKKVSTSAWGTLEMLHSTVNLHKEFYSESGFLQMTLHFFF